MNLIVPESMDTPARRRPSRRRLARWLMAKQVRSSSGTRSERARQHPWWAVMCLTGVDYFSTLSYLPAIAALAAGAVSPLAMCLVVALTLFGVLPMYRRVARESPDGKGSMAMLDNLLPFWKGKLFVLVLLGFVATAWLVTITLSAADATVHVVENPYVPEPLTTHPVAVTCGLLIVLAGVFLVGFSEAVVVAVPLVIAFLGLNAVVVAVGAVEVVTRPGAWSAWVDSLTSGGLQGIAVPALLAFPLLALGLSGFETGVSMMPLVKEHGDNDEQRLASRVRNTHKLLTVAACIMSVYLIATSFVTVVLIPEAAFESGGPANGRALAYLAHEYLGPAFGTAYDVSSVLILWFAGASAMAGLINIVPRYLPAYGMAPNWAQAVRPVVLVYLACAIALTISFEADVNAQSGAYATGVLAMLLSASVAVTLAAARRRARGATAGFAVVTVVLLYALGANVIEKPGGIVIASILIGSIIVVSLVSRIARTTEIRADRIEFDERARTLLTTTLDRNGEIHLIAHRRDNGDEREYAQKEAAQRGLTAVPRRNALLLEIDVVDPSDFSDTLEVCGVEIGAHSVLRARSPAEPNAIAALLLALRDATDTRPHCHFDWAEANPVSLLLRYLLFGHGDTAPVVREILRQAEPDPVRRPGIHVGE